MEHVFNTFLTFVATFAGVFLAGVILFFMAKKVITGYLLGYFTSPDKETPSPVAQLVALAADTFSTRLTAQLKSTFMGMQSGESRAEQALAGDLALDMASQGNPMIGAIFSSFPSVAKRLRKNPELLPLAEQLINRLAKPKAAATAGASSGSNGGGSSVSFDTF